MREGYVDIRSGSWIDGLGGHIGDGGSLGIGDGGTQV